MEENRPIDTPTCVKPPVPSSKTVPTPPDVPTPPPPMPYLPPKRPRGMEEPGKKSKGFNWMWLIGIIVVVALAVVAFVLFIISPTGEDVHKPHRSETKTMALNAAEDDDSDAVKIKLYGTMENTSGARMELSVEGKIVGDRVKDGVATIDSRKYVMIGEIMDGENYRLICTGEHDKNDIYVINILPMNGHFEGEAIHGTRHYSVVME